jgi:hypothetical protein
MCIHTDPLTTHQSQCRQDGDHTTTQVLSDYQNCIMYSGSYGMMSSSFGHPTQTQVEDDVTMVGSALRVLRRFALPLVFLFVGLLLWLTWYIPAWFPGSRVVAIRLLNERLLFVVMLSLSLVVLLFWLLLWKVPQWQVVNVFSSKDRIDLETKSRQTMAQILGGAAVVWIPGASWSLRSMCVPFLCVPLLPRMRA